MVGEELHRDDEDLVAATRRDLREQLLQVGAQPLLLRVSGALVCPAPSVRRQRYMRRDQIRRLAQLRDVAGFGLEHATRKTVCGENDGRVAGLGLADELGQRLDERALAVPRLRG